MLILKIEQGTIEKSESLVEFSTKCGWTVGVVIVHLYPLNQRMSIRLLLKALLRIRNDPLSQIHTLFGTPRVGVGLVRCVILNLDICIKVLKIVEFSEGGSNNTPFGVVFI